MANLVELSNQLEKLSKQYNKTEKISLNILLLFLSKIKIDVFTPEYG